MGMEEEGRMGLEWEGWMGMEGEGRVGLEWEGWMGIEEDEMVGLEWEGRIGLEEDRIKGLEWEVRIELEENEEESFLLSITVIFASTGGGRRTREGKKGSPRKLFSSLTFCGSVLIFGGTTWFSFTRELAKQEKLCQNEKKSLKFISKYNKNIKNKI